MASFDKAIIKILLNEGGSKYTEVPLDKGGPTKWGISQKSYPKLDIKSLTEQEAKDIYKEDFWEKILGDKITDQTIAENVLDTCINMGLRTGTKVVQVVLGVKVDGYFGEDTLAKLNTCENFLLLFTLAKVARYVSIVNKDRSQSKFLLGWLNRALR